MSPSGASKVVNWRKILQNCPGDMLILLSCMWRGELWMWSMVSAKWLSLISWYCSDFNYPIRSELKVLAMLDIVLLKFISSLARLHSLCYCTSWSWSAGTHLWSSTSNLKPRSDFDIFFSPLSSFVSPWTHCYNSRLALESLEVIVLFPPPVVRPIPISSARSKHFP